MAMGGRMIFVYNVVAERRATATKWVFTMEIDKAIAEQSDRFFSRVFCAVAAE